LTLSLLVAALLAARSRAAIPALDEERVEAAAVEAVPLLQKYLRVDTTNPPGNERRAADFLKTVFDREGIECEVLDQGGNRANVVARLRGTGRKRPLLLLNHLDVVPADAARWTVPPFSGELKDGFVWGRGATDMKGTAICQLMTMLLLKRSGKPLDRDVIFLGTADEEDGAANGLEWVIRERRALLGNAELALTEGNTLSLTHGATDAWNVDVTEKSVLWVRVVAEGKAGHASIPEPDGAVAHLVRALTRLLAFEPQAHVTPAVAAYFKELSKTAGPGLREDLANPAEALRNSERRRRLLSDPLRNAFLRPTVSITGLSGSSKVNVIPGEATAALDCRLLPGDDPLVFLEALEAVADDPSLRFQIVQATKATESPIDTELFRAIVRARDRFEPGVPVMTPPLTSSTDASKLREIGVVVYGFEPFHIGEGDDRSHGDDERLSVANLAFGIKVTYAVVWDVAGAR
jgi:acetylornithine deacetylase/succinyl-diaminopimelate desuccinylase-like protein